MECMYTCMYTWNIFGCHEFFVIYIGIIIGYGSKLESQKQVKYLYGFAKETAKPLMNPYTWDFWVANGCENPASRCSKHMGISWNGGIMGYPQMVGEWKSHENGWFGSTPILGNTHISKAALSNNFTCFFYMFFTFYHPQKLEKNKTKQHLQPAHLPASPGCPRCPRLLSGWRHLIWYSPVPLPRRVAEALCPMTSDTGSMGLRAPINEPEPRWYFAGNNSGMHSCHPCNDTSKDTWKVPNFNMYNVQSYYRISYTCNLHVTHALLTRHSHVSSNVSCRCSARRQRMLRNFTTPEPSSISTDLKITRMKA